MSDGRLAMLDLFSGIGGIALALRPYARAVAYCEADAWCRGNLLTNMARGWLDTAPIHHDVRRLDAAGLRSIGVDRIDLVTAGFPCQDISVAGAGAGLAGERSGLFFQVARLAGELGPRFIFLENVAAITRRGLDTVVGTLVGLGYDCRWTILPAAEAGAPHLRRRWWLLAHAHGVGERQPEGGIPCLGGRSGDGRSADSAANSDGERCEECYPSSRIGGMGQSAWGAPAAGPLWCAEPDVGRVADGIPLRVDRLRGLGNAVVPQAAEAAFRYLIGLDELP